MVKVLGLGDNVCDIYLNQGMMYPGGQALNVAVYAKQLGVQSDFLGVNGTDEVAEHVLRTLDELGVGHSRCRRTRGENGFACVTLIDGDRVFLGSNKGGVLQKTPIKLGQDDLTHIDCFDVVHTTNNGFIDEQLPLLAPLSPLISYDFSYRWNEQDRLERVCSYIDFSFLSCSELSEDETFELCEHVYKKGCGVVVATRGSKGAFVWDGARIYRQPPYAVQAIDTMGAGDSFAACLLVRLAQALKNDGKDRWTDANYRAKILPPALADAAAFASKTCLVHGSFGYGTPVPASLKTRIKEVVS